MDGSSSAAQGPQDDSRPENGLGAEDERCQVGQGEGGQVTKKQCAVQDKWGVSLCKRKFWTRRRSPAFCAFHRRHEALTPSEKTK